MRIAHFLWPIPMKCLAAACTTYFVEVQIPIYPVSVPRASFALFAFLDSHRSVARSFYVRRISHSLIPFAFLPLLLLPRPHYIAVHSEEIAANQFQYLYIDKATFNYRIGCRC